MFLTLIVDIAVDVSDTVSSCDQCTDDAALLSGSHCTRLHFSSHQPDTRFWSVRCIYMQVIVVTS